MTDTMIRSTATLRPGPTCEAKLAAFDRTRGIPPYCRRQVALGSFLDRNGVRRFACQAEGHRGNVVRQYGEWPEIDTAVFDEPDCGHEAVTDIEPVHGILYGICAGCGLTVSATGDEYEDGTPSWEPTDNQPSVYATEWHGHRVEAEVV